MKFKKGDTIKLKSDADVTLSYKSGSPPIRFIKNSIWMVDAIEDIDDEIQMLNISTFEPEYGINAGSYCSFVSNEDVLEKVKYHRIKKENIMKRSELKQLIKEIILEQSNLIKFADLKNGQEFYIDYEDGKWIAYKKKKLGGNNAEIIATYNNDKKVIGNQVYIQAFKLVTPIK